MTSRFVTELTALVMFFSVAPAWADIRPIRSTDRNQEGHFQTVKLARVTIRYRPGIKSKMRVKLGAQSDTTEE